MFVDINTLDQRDGLALGVDLALELVADACDELLERSKERERGASEISERSKDEGLNTCKGVRSRQSTARLVVRRFRKKRGSRVLIHPDNRWTDMWVVRR
jgi:hypothetical protein